MFKKNLLKWIFRTPHNEQNVYERRLIKVMRELKVENYHFNWDRTSCLIEFHYLDDFYRLEHSIEGAKRNGLFLGNGLDCLMGLTQSLEDLCAIINRGTYNFETWIEGMKQSPSGQNMPEFQEEFQIRYRSMSEQKLPNYNTEEYIPFETESSLGDTDRYHYNRNIPQRRHGQRPLI